MNTPKKSERIAHFVDSLGVASDGGWDPRYLGFFQCFNRGDYYEAHDVLEDLWLKINGPDYEFYKGLIQVAGAFVHLRKQYEQPGHHHHGRRLVPAARLFRIAVNRLQAFAPAHLGVDVTGLIELCEDSLSAIESSECRNNPWDPANLPNIALAR